MSEELSEIDDAELDGMLGDEEMVDAPADSMDAEGSTVQRAQRAKARVQQRRNASRRVNGVNQG